MKSWLHPSYLIIALCWVAYAALNLLAPHTTSLRYQLGPTQTLLLQISIFIPVLLIWLIAIRGANAFKAYSQLLKGSPESAAIRLIADGLVCTLIYLVSTALAGAMMPFLVDTTWYDLGADIHNHLPAWVALVAFTLLYQGSRALSRIAPFRTWTPATVVLLIGYGLFTIIIVQAFLSISPAEATAAVYALPRRVLVFTMLLPYLLGWFLGLLAALNISRYAHLVKGTLYRQALRYLVLGILSVIVFAVVTQVLALASRFVVGFDLVRLLFTVYVLLALYGLGFWFVRLGAHRLARIEVVK